VLLIIRTIVYPDVPPQGGGGYRPDTFDHLMHLRIACPGLDASWQHTLIDATVAADGASAELTLHSEPPPGVSLDRSIRVVTWQPAAHIKAHDTAGKLLATTKLDAPLQPGQLIELGGKPYRVADEPTWPGRHPVHGTCRADIDWQHVTLVADPQPPHEPTRTRD
jgi:hypothetical protein